MKIYNGWVLKINYQEFVILGSMKIRGSQVYILKSKHDDAKRSINREILLSGINDKTITYIGNEK